MRHRVSGKQLSRTPSHRKAMRRNMAASLFQHGAIRTTEAKAKELRRFVERLITIAREGTLHARRRVIRLLQDRKMANDDGEFEDQTVVQKLFNDIAPRYVDRPGGYTRIIRIAERRIGDAGVQVILQLVEETSAEPTKPSGKSRRQKRAAKRYEAVKADQPKKGKDDEDDEQEEQPDDDEKEEPPEPDEADESDESEEPQEGEDDAEEESKDE